MEELDFLTEMLLDIAERPARFGDPEQAECLGKHTTHVCLSIIHPIWSFDLTEKFWNEIATLLGGDRNFTAQVSEEPSYRQEKWGQGESAARLLVLQANEGIWRALQSSSHKLFLHMSDWVEFLLTGQLVIGNPDKTALVLRSLIAFSLDDVGYQHFFKMYEMVCRQVKGFTSRGLLDVGTTPEWELPAPAKMSDLLPAFNQVSQGLGEVIVRLKSMRGTEIALVRESFKDKRKQL